MTAPPLTQPATPARASAVRWRAQQPASAFERGFSLVEILVALVIGLFATLVVLQMFTDAERRNRATSSTADAQSTGMIAFYQLQDQVQKSGFGINSVNLLGCPTKWNVVGGALISMPMVLAPVSINPQTTNGTTATALIPAGDTNTDTLLIFSGNGAGQPEGSKISGQISATSYPLQSISNIAIGDRVILSPDSLPGSCGSGLLVDRITATNSGTSAVTVASGNGTTIGTAALYDLGPGPNGANAVPTSTTPANGPSILAYAVRSQQLTVCDFTVNDCSLATKTSDQTIWVPVAANVVSLRALYLDDRGAALGHAPTATQPVLACDWAHATAISLVMVTRSDEVEHNPEHPNLEYVTNAGVNAPVWTYDSAVQVPLSDPSSAWRTNLADSQTWRKYRYKTLEAPVSLRNIAWINRSVCP